MTMITNSSHAALFPSLFEFKNFIQCLAASHPACHRAHQPVEYFILSFPLNLLASADCKIHILLLSLMRIILNLNIAGILITRSPSLPFILYLQNLFMSIFKLSSKIIITIIHLFIEKIIIINSINLNPAWILIVVHVRMPVRPYLEGFHRLISCDPVNAGAVRLGM